MANAGRSHIISSFSKKRLSSSVTWEVRSKGDACLYTFVDQETIIWRLGAYAQLSAFPLTQERIGNLRVKLPAIPTKLSSSYSQSSSSVRSREEIAFLLTSIHLCASKKASSQLTEDCSRHSITKTTWLCELHRRAKSVPAGPHMEAHINVRQFKEANTAKVFKTRQANRQRLQVSCIKLTSYCSFPSDHQWMNARWNSNAFPSHHLAAAYLVFHPTHLRLLSFPYFRHSTFTQRSNESLQSSSALLVWQESCCFPQV